MPDMNAVPEQRLPILMIVVGRQRGGKTSAVNTIQQAREGGDIRI